MSANSLNPFGVREVSKLLTITGCSNYDVLIPLESGKFLNKSPTLPKWHWNCLNPFGVREVSKRSNSFYPFQTIRLNPFGVREVSKQFAENVVIQSIRLNPFGVREVSKRNRYVLQWHRGS